MTRTILVAGTASHVGKSTVAAGLCRALAREGIDVAPFKAQNMSNNARVALVPDGEWGEIGVSQYVQARAARVVPQVDHNPVLLKPRGDGESQLVIGGSAVGHFEAGNYYGTQWDRARAAAVESHRRLAADHDLIVAEGAGGFGEINLHDRDLANVETARFADADVVLVADIERGGAFASLYGTLELLPDDLRPQVSGLVITKFHGDRSLLDPGIQDLESMTGVPVLGVIPYEDPGLPAEDSVSLPATGESSVRGDEDGIPADRSVTVAVPRLPRISNFTDLEPLAREPGVRVAYVPLSGSLADADAVVLPGSKNTVDDCLALRDSGLADEIREFDGPIVGLCGGYQILGARIENASVEGTGDRDRIPGLGLLPVVTRFSTDKRVERVTRRVDDHPLLSGVDGALTGYEIHMGTTRAIEGRAEVVRPIGPESAAVDGVLGTYCHGLFENEGVRSAFVDAVFEASGRDRPTESASSHSPYERAADLVTAHVDWSAIGLPVERSHEVT